MMKSMFLLLSFNLLLACRCAFVEGLGLAKTNPKESKSNATSLSEEFLSILEFGLVAITDEVKIWKKDQGKCVELKQNMDAAMENYKRHIAVSSPSPKNNKEKEDAAKEVLKLVGEIQSLDIPCFNNALDIALANALFIARDYSGLPNSDKEADNNDAKPSKAKQFGEQFGKKIGFFFQIL